MAEFRSALVVEGGAMRGIFAAGVLDVFLESDFTPFELGIGVSVGASNLLSFLAGQHGRTRRCFLNQMSRKEFIDGWRFVRGGHLTDLDWLWDEITREDPLDVSAAAKSPVDYAIGVTCAETGRPVYFKPDAEKMLNVLKASCAIPLLYRGQILVDGARYVDGGVSDPIPVREAYRRGARNIMVVRSRAADFVKKGGLSTRIGTSSMPKGIAKACRGTADEYRTSVEFIRRPPADCSIVHVAPVHPLATSRTTRSREALERDYALGRELGTWAMSEWHARHPRHPNRNEQPIGSVLS